MRWVLEKHQEKHTPVILRPDSELAMGWIIEDLTAHSNKELISYARNIYARLLTQRRGKVWWKHVKGHSGHYRNDCADRLADEGAKTDTMGGNGGSGEMVESQRGWRTETRQNEGKELENEDENHVDRGGSTHTPNPIRE